MQPALFFYVVRTEILDKSFDNILLSLPVFHHKDLSEILKKEMYSHTFPFTAKMN